MRDVNARAECEVQPDLPVSPVARRRDAPKTPAPGMYSQDRNGGNFFPRTAQNGGRLSGLRLPRFPPLGRSSDWVFTSWPGLSSPVGRLVQVHLCHQHCRGRQQISQALAACSSVSPRQRRSGEVSSEVLHHRDHPLAVYRWVRLSRRWQGSACLFITIN
ncbi:unnamed protein product [Lampetra planeri]